MNQLEAALWLIRAGDINRLLDRLGKLTDANRDGLNQARARYDRARIPRQR